MGVSSPASSVMTEMASWGIATPGEKASVMRPSGLRVAVKVVGTLKMDTGPMGHK